MHETVIASQIIEEAEKQGAVKSINVEVGELGHLTAEELTETLNALVDWEITVTYKHATVSCRCGYEGRPKVLERGHDICVFVCPKCGSAPTVMDGDQIRLLSVEIE